MKIAAICNSKLGVPALQQLAQTGQLIALGMPDEKGEEQYEVEAFAAQIGLSPQKINRKNVETDIHSWLLSVGAETLFIFTFPYILPNSLLEQMRIPIINFHYAPLPEYRGAQPLFWIIKNGEAKGGVTAHELVKKVDAGPIVHFQEVAIRPTETYGMHTVNLAMAGAACVAQVLHKMSQKDWKKNCSKQNEAKAKYWGKPTMADVSINWGQMSDAEVIALCKATNPWNKGAISTYQGLPLKLVSLKSVNFPLAQSYEAGEIVAADQANGILIATANQKVLRLEIVYIEQGFFTGEELLQWGIQKGKKFI